ncbi:MAG TPA: hypothetical protein VMI06_00300, partial [Terriglobia bacterium]|nr:hypothetical protein [Terriglobia bacterium]
MRLRNNGHILSEADPLLAQPRDFELRMSSQAPNVAQAERQVTSLHRSTDFEPQEQSERGHTRSHCIQLTLTMHAHVADRRPNALSQQDPGQTLRSSRRANSSCF